MAMALKRDGKAQRVFCIVGDGEMHEGPMWEALLFAAHHKLDNLIVIVDANGFQAMGEVEKVVNLEPFPEKFKAFGWEARECDGHDLDALTKALGAWPKGKPLALVARTVKGKGVSFMENKNEWHYLRLTPEQLKQALSEVEGKVAHA
jgi:transketolase